MYRLFPFAASVELRTALAGAASVETAKVGKLLFKQGEKAKGVFLVESGRVELTLSDHDGNWLSSRIAGEGSVLGVPATMTGSTYTLSARVVEKAELRFVSRADFQKLLRKSPVLCMQVVKILAHEVSHVRRHETALSRIEHMCRAKAAAQ